MPWEFEGGNFNFAKSVMKSYACVRLVLLVLPVIVRSTDYVLVNSRYFLTIFSILTTIQSLHDTVYNVLYTNNHSIIT